MRMRTLIIMLLVAWGSARFSDAADKGIAPAPNQNHEEKTSADAESGKTKPEGKATPGPDKTADKDAGATDEYAKLASALAASAEEEKEIFYYQCRYVRSGTLKKILSDFVSTAGTVAESEESDMVVVSDVKSNIAKLKSIAENIDHRVPQIFVAAQIVELTLDDNFERELNLSLSHTGDDSFVSTIMSALLPSGVDTTALNGRNAGGQATFRPYTKSYGSGKSTTLTSVLRYLETKGKAKILSAPNLVLRRGYEGSIVTGDEVPILQQTTTSGSITTTTEYKSVGIKLKVTPLMVHDDVVRLSVTPEVSSVTSYNSAGNPTIANRCATTELELKDGELMSIGGLLKNEERLVKSRVPIASSVPVLGHFFRASQTETVRTQLVIFLTIRILQESEPNDITLMHPDELPPTIHEEIDRLDKAAKPPKAQILQDIDRYCEEGHD